MKVMNLKLKWSGAKVGFVDNNGNWVIEPRFDNARGFSEGFAAVKEGGKWGYIDREGRWLVEPQFHKVGDFIGGFAPVDNEHNIITTEGKILCGQDVDFWAVHPFSEGLAWVHNNHGDGFINAAGHIVIPLKLKDASDFHDGVAAATAFVVDGLEMEWAAGFIDREGNWEIKPQFAEARGFSDGLAAVMIESDGEEKWGFIDRKGEYAVKPRFVQVFDFHNGVAAAAVRENGLLKLGIIDKTGKWVMEPQFESKSEFKESDGLIRVIQNEKAGFINLKGEWVIKPKFQSANDFTEGISIVKYRNLYGVINKKGKWIIKPAYSFILIPDENEPYFVVKDGEDKYGCFDFEGNQICSPAYDNIGRFFDGFAVVEQGAKEGLIDREGNLIVKPKYSEIELDYYCEGSDFIKVRIGRKYGLLNREGKVAVPVKYQFIEERKNGIFSVQAADKWGYIAADGKMIVEPEFDVAEDFTEQGIARVGKGGKKGFINLEGAMLGGRLYDDAGVFSEGFAKVKSDGLWGFIDTEGNMVVEPSYKIVKDFRQGNAIVGKGGKYGYLNSRGEEVFPLKADEAADFNSFGLARVEIDGKVAIIRTDGTYAFGPLEGKINIFMEDGLAAVRTDEMKWGLIDTNGRYVYEPVFDGMTVYKKGATEVRVGGKTGFLDRKGGYIIEPEIDDFKGFGHFLNLDGYISAARVGDKWGFVGREGVWLVRPRYDKVDDFKGETARVYLNGKVGLVSIHGGKTMVEPDKFDDIAYFQDAGDTTYYRVKIDDKWGVVDMDGNWFVKPELDEIGPFERLDFKSRGATVRIGDKWGFINARGETVVEPIYDEIFKFCDAGKIYVARTRIDDKYGYIGIDGSVISKPIFDDAFDFESDSKAKVMKGDDLGYIDLQGNWIDEDWDEEDDEEWEEEWDEDEEEWDEDE